MGAIIAQILRVAVMALVSAIPITVAQEFFDGTVKDIVKAIRDEGGLTEDEAKDILINILFDLGINATLLGTIMKTKVALKTADYLGLTTKGFSKRTLSAKQQAAQTKIASAVTKTAGISLLKKVLAGAGVIGTFIWLTSALANIIEPGIYKPEQTNAVYRSLGIPYQFPVTPGALKPGPFDSDQFKDYANALEAVGVKGFEYGFPIGTVLYSRDTLANLINYVYGKELVKGNALTYKQMIPLLEPYLIVDKKPTTTTTPKPTTTTSTVSVPKVQVFTGVLSQGVLKNGLEFQARPDDLIESAQEMLEAASNNLAPFIAALPSRITYQVRVVSSITTKDGFTQKGSVTQILSGYSSTGAPKYKTVVNKFAVLDIYILNDKSSRVKITTIVLGPVDSVKFQVGQSTLTEIDNGLKQVAVTSNIGDIKGIATNAPITVQAPTSAPATPTTSKHYNFVIGRFGNAEIWSDETLAAVQARGDWPNKVISYGEWKAHPDKSYNAADPEIQLLIANEEAKLPRPVTSAPSSSVVSTPAPSPTPVSTPSPAPAVASPPAPKPGANAATLAEWYAANGRALPTIQERSLLYQQYGLGQAAFYTGTAEQNTKLLNMLKSL